MAATIAQASVAFSKLFGGGGNYSHFTLHTEEPGETQVDLADASDGREPLDATDQSDGSSSCRSRPAQQLSRRNTCYVALATFLIFVIGYLVGYVTHRSPHLQPLQPSSGCGPKPEIEEDKEVPVSVEEPPLYWKNIPDLLGKKLTVAGFDKTLRDLAMEHHEAGSDGDNLLANRILGTFRGLGMEPWNDVHFVQLQKQDSEHPNRVLIGSEEVGRPQGYLAYSAKGTVQGPAVYGNYGRLEDLDVLLKNNVELKGCVMLLRAGPIGFAQQVLNAAERGASAVLIYLDPKDYNYVNTIELYGHVHLGSGDPYTPGFPSLNHTQFPPTRSSGLPSIPAQTITAETAARILRTMGGPVADSGFQGDLVSVTYHLGGGDHNVTVEVHNTLVDTRIYNVFGVIKGFSDPDHYVVLGAQRDAWGPGYAKSTVGTAILMELARVMHDMVENDNFRPLRSIVFASWSAGEYGSVGSMEWLEAYMSSLDRKVFTYISLDGAVAGLGSFTASASPLLNSLLEGAMKEVVNPVGPGTLYASAGGSQWARKVLRPMPMEDPAYPFLAFSGIPSLSFRFFSANATSYPLYGTVLDNADHLAYATGQRTGEMAALAGRLAGLMALKLVHTHLLPLHLDGYASAVFQAVVQVNRHVAQLSKAGDLPGVSTQWLTSALSSFRSAARAFHSDVDNSDLGDKQACRVLNDRLMAVEHNLLSPYVSPRSVPFRHLLLGRGAHTLASIAGTTDAEQLHTQLALATWTLQGCANAMAAHIWDVDNQI